MGGSDLFSPNGSQGICGCGNPSVGRCLRNGRHDERTEAGHSGSEGLLWPLLSSHCVMSDSLRLHVAHQALLSMAFSRQEYCSGLPFPSPGDIRDPGIEPRSPALQADFYCLNSQGSPYFFKFFPMSSVPCAMP